MLSGHRLFSRGGQQEAQATLKRDKPLLVIIKPPEDIYNEKLKRVIGKEMVTSCLTLPCDKRRMAGASTTDKTRTHGCGKIFSSRIPDDCLRPQRAVRAP